MLPIGLNMCSPTDQELITLAKGRYALVGGRGGVRGMRVAPPGGGHAAPEVSPCPCPPPQKDTDEEVREFLNNNLHLQGKVRGGPVAPPPCPRCVPVVSPSCPHGPCVPLCSP